MALPTLSKDLIHASVYYFHHTHLCQSALAYPVFGTKALGSNFLGCIHLFEFVGSRGIILNLHIKLYLTCPSTRYSRIVVSM